MPDVSASQPVFVDASGRRRRLLRAVGAAGGGVLLLFLVLIGIGVATGSGVPLTPWSPPHADGPHGGPAGANGDATLEPKGGGSATGKHGSRPAVGPSLPGRGTASGGPGHPNGQPALSTPTSSTPASPGAGPSATASPSGTHSPAALGKRKKNP